MANLLALVGDVYCIFVTFLCGILGQVWYLIVLFPEIVIFLTFIWISSAVYYYENQRWATLVLLVNLTIAFQVHTSSHHQHQAHVRF